MKQYKIKVFQSEEEVLEYFSKFYKAERVAFEQMNGKIVVFFYDLLYDYTYVYTAPDYSDYYDDLDHPHRLGRRNQSYYDSMEWE